LIRSFLLLLSWIALGVFTESQAFAEQKSHECWVVNNTAGKLTMTMEDGSKQHTHAVPPAAKVTIDGKPAKLEDLKEHYHIKVTTDNNVVTSIQAQSKKTP
jgi:hypothetical protein